MVEVRGVEPLSESTSSETSPGAGDYLNSLDQAQVAMLKVSVASLCVVRSKLCALTDAANRRRTPGPRHSWGDAHCLSSEEFNVIVVL